MLKKRTYTIKEKDTLWGIAKKYYGVGSLYYLITRENNIDNPDKIQVGQKIKIPMDVVLVEKVSDDNE